jgi:hypothetical protein
MVNMLPAADRRSIASADTAAKLLGAAFARLDLGDDRGVVALRLVELGDIALPTRLLGIRREGLLSTRMTKILSRTDS